MTDTPPPQRDTTPPPGPIATLFPGYFALVMATGIIAVASKQQTIDWLADVLYAIAAFRAKPDRGWGWLLFSGVVSLILGILIWRQWPMSGLWAIGILLGIRILMAGFGMIFVGSATRQIGKVFSDQA